MANPKGGPEHTRWKPGQSGNASGKPKQLLTKDRVTSILGKFANMSRADLEAVMEDPKATMIEVMIASVMVKAVRDGDYGRLDFLLNRSVGKVKEELEQTVRNVTNEDLDKINRDVLIKLVSGE
jgi:hypothetical protein